MVTKPDICKAFTDRFDRMVCLNLAERTDRRTNILRQFRSLGIDGHVEFHTAVKHPHSQAIMDGLNKSGKGCFTKPNEFSCAREHYTIIKKAYLQNVEHLLIFEDDVLFMKDFEYIVNTLDNMPEGWQCCQFGGFTVDEKVFEKSIRHDSGYWMQGIPVWNMSMVALGREAMRQYISMQDYQMNVADFAPYIWNNQTPGAIVKTLPNSLTRQTWLTTRPVVIQNLSVESDIRGWDLNIRNTNINAYEAWINAEDYGPGGN